METYFSFCSSVWECCGETKITSLQRLQNRVARIIANKLYDYSATSVLKELGWSSVEDIIFEETSIMAFKALRHDLGLSYLRDLFQNLTEVHKRELRNTQTDLRVLPRTSCNGQKSISYRGAQFWNKLNNDQKSAPSLTTFRKKLAPCLLLFSFCLILCYFFRF